MNAKIEELKGGLSSSPSQPALTHFERFGKLLTFQIEKEKWCFIGVNLFNFWKQTRLKTCMGPSGSIQSSK